MDCASFIVKRIKIDAGTYIFFHHKIENIILTAAHTSLISKLYQNKINMRHFKIIGLLISLFSTIIPYVHGQVAGNDIDVAPSANKFFKFSRVSVAYDGTIYVGRVFSATAGGLYNNWEVVKSTDKGVTFGPFASGSATTGYQYTAFDLVAAGNNSTDFRLFVARPILNTSMGLTQFIFSKFKDDGSPTTIELSGSSYTGSRGYSSVSLATDSRDKNGFANPYSISVVAAKGYNPNDSIVAWVDNLGGTNLQRRGIYGTTNFIRTVSASLGSVNASLSSYGRLGMAWDEFSGSSTPWGAIYTKYVYGDNGSTASNGGPHQIGSSAAGYRNPSIALSQNTTGGTGPGNDDIRTVILYEYDYTSIGEGTNIYARASDVILTGIPTFAANPNIADGVGEQINPHVSYDAMNDNFLITYYDEETKTLVYKQKSLAGTVSANPTTISLNYRQAQHSMNLPMPRVDMGTMANKAVFVWNDGDSTKFDAEQSYVSIQESSINLTDLTLFPNPAQDITTLKFISENDDLVQLRVMDLMGKTISNQQTTTTYGENMVNIDVSTLAPGRYTLYIHGKSTNGTVAFIVSR
jgi:hypothetical protein